MASAAQPRSPVDERRLDEVRNGFRGDVVLPGDESYDDVRAIWNGMIDKRPAVVLRATGAADVVTAVNFARESGLELAVRGSGGNFGVVTSFEYALYDVGPDVYTVFVWFRADDAREVLARFREWAETAPRDSGVLPFVGHVPETDDFPEESWGEPAVAFLGSSRRDAAEAEAVFDPIAGATTPIADFSGPLSYEALQSMLDEDYPDGMRYHWKSIFLTELTDEVIDLVTRYSESTLSELSTIDLWHLGGAVSDVPRDATAFWHRDKPYMLTFEANWESPEDDEANVRWVREGFAEVEALSVASGRYGNFPGFADDPAHVLYGENYERLVDVKTKYDPTNLFRRNQNVPPRSVGTDVGDEGAPDGSDSGGADSAGESP